MPVDPQLRAQIELILDRHREDVRVFPEDWEEADDVEYLYRKNTILVRERDVDRVTDALPQILGEEGREYAPPAEGPPFGPERVVGEVFRLMVPDPPPPLPTLLDRLDAFFGKSVARLDHMLYVSPHSCPATEPIAVPGWSDPVPPAGVNARCCRHHHIPPPGCDGAGVTISIVDTGLIPNAATGHSWLAGVRGSQEDPYTTDADGNRIIAPYAGHGTFVAGVARCMAPRASAYVERGFRIDAAGAAFETDLALRLEDALDRNPDILVFTFVTTSRNDHSLFTFDDIFRRRIRYLKGLVVLAPAGNDGQRRRNWPAAYREVISVGALAANSASRAYFSNYGRWVDVYAPGEDLVNAFPTGTYVCNEPPIGERREFHGMAKWSGTSFSTPVVAGMIAARMSATGENAQQAADSLLRIACRQAIPGVGAVLHPGQACCEAGHCGQGCDQEDGQEGCRCGK